MPTGLGRGDMSPRFFSWVHFQLGPDSLGPHPSYEMHGLIINLVAPFRKIKFGRFVPKKIGGCSKIEKQIWTAN
jgi:hypothetical protein